MARRFKTTVQLDSGLLIPAGAAAGKVLTSDASGNATWVAGASVPIESVHYIGGAGEPAFQSTWVNLDNNAAVPGSALQRSVGYWKDPGGIVHLTGFAKAGVSGTNIFILPVGWRPTAGEYQVVMASGGVAYVTIDQASGGVAAFNHTTGCAVATYVCLDGITFDVGQTTWPTGPQGLQGGDYGPPLVTTLPGSPSDGEECHYQNAAMAALGIVWHLRYRAAASGSYKWEMVGGSALASNNNTAETVTATTAVVTANSPTITAPLDGEYHADYGAQVRNNTASQWVSVNVFKNGATTGINVLKANSSGTPLAVGNSISSEWNLTLVAGDVIAHAPQVSAGSANVAMKYLRLRPVRVG